MASRPLAHTASLPAEMSITTALSAVVDLARHGPAHGPNPRVGCILLSPSNNSSVSAQPNNSAHPSNSAQPGADQRRVLAFGWHRGAGTPHAEAAALADARARGVDVTGATAVVSLEPCNHVGRTGPCSDALLTAGIGEVVYAVSDPNPEATGGGARLSEAGVTVLGPTEPGAGPGHTLLQPWLTSTRAGRPFVTLKLAMTLDGRIAAADGSSRWITSGESRAHAHDFRGQVGAIAIGTGTALTDDPALTARPATTESATDLSGWQPMRVVVGNRDIPAGARLRGAGGELVQIASHDPEQVLAELNKRGVRHLLVEGGPTLATAFLASGLVDEVHAYVAPVFLGAGKSALNDLGITTIGDALRLEVHETLRLGPDTLIRGTPTTIPTTTPTPPQSLSARKGLGSEPKSQPFSRTQWEQES